MPLPRLLRFGLRHVAAGMLSVLALGVLNRVLKVELGVGLAVTALIVGANYFAAPVALVAGRLSDTRPLFGRRRTPYILGGTLLTALCVALAPFAALLVAREATPLAVALAVGLFLLMGAGMFSSGAAYLALLTDLTPAQERDRAVAVTWSMLMLGILAGVGLGVGALRTYSDERLIALFAVMALLLLLLTTVAVWGQERRLPAGWQAPVTSTLADLRQPLAGRQTRRFFAFLFSGILFLFLQQAVLEPFGGDVFDLSLRETTAFNGYLMVGVLLAMAATGGWLCHRLGARRTAALGLALSMVAFALLTLAALGRQAALLRPAVFVLGLGMGVFNVGGLALMMGMSAPGRVGLYMGLWTLCESLANGSATIGGGAIHEAGRRFFGSEPAAYATVFALSATGLLLTLGWLRRLDLAAFHREDAVYQRSAEGRPTLAEQVVLVGGD